MAETFRLMGFNVTKDGNRFIAVPRGPGDPHKIVAESMEELTGMLKSLKGKRSGGSVEGTRPHRRMDKARRR